jgi:hypothetical protein
VTSPDPEGAGWELHIGLNAADDGIHVGEPVTGELFLERAAAPDSPNHNPSRVPREVQVLMYFRDPNGCEVPGHDEPDSALGGTLETDPAALETNHLGFQIMPVCPGPHTLSAELLGSAGERLGDTTLRLNVRE